jgi:hypothetical protein
MPDQARYDGQKLSTFLNFDTVWKTGILVDWLNLFWIPAFAGMTVYFTGNFPIPQPINYLTNQPIN